MKIEEIFKKLKPISEGDLDILWQEYILSDAKTQKNIEDVLGNVPQPAQEGQGGAGQGNAQGGSQKPPKGDEKTNPGGK